MSYTHETESDESSKRNTAGSLREQEDKIDLVGLHEGIKKWSDLEICDVREKERR